MHLEAVALMTATDSQSKKDKSLPFVWQSSNPLSDRALYTHAYNIHHHHKIESAGIIISKSNKTRDLFHEKDDVRQVD